MTARRRGGDVLPCLTTVLGLVACAVPAGPAGAQELATAVLQGEVTRSGAPVPDQTVQLHRVSADTAGEIDSAQTGRDGRFRFVLPRVPDPSRQEVYFASTRFSGILYFGHPVSTPADLDSAYVLEVYDTVSAPAQGAGLPVSIRTVFAEPAGDGWTLTDLFEVRNDGSRTLVAREGGAVWTYPLFEGARDVELGEGDAGRDAFSYVGGRVRITAPVPPGSRLYVFRYTVPSLVGALTLPGVTDRVELLIREPAPPLAVLGLSSAAPVEIESGSTYRRFIGDGVTDRIVRLEAAQAPPSIPYGWLVVSLGLLLAGLGLWATRRTTGRSRDDLIEEIARLDEAFEAMPEPAPRDRVLYERSRSRLLRRLRHR